MKSCTQCLQVKPLIEFNRHSGHLDGHMSMCRMCSRDMNKAWYMRNRVARRETMAAWSEAHPEITRARTRRYRQSPKGRQYYAACDRKRRARMHGADGYYTAADVRRQYNIQQGLCYYCHDVLQRRYHVDHKIPLARNGTDWPDNLCCACPMCNTKKGIKTHTEFMRSMHA